MADVKFTAEGDYIAFTVYPDSPDSKEEIDMTTATTDAITHWDAKPLPALDGRSGVAIIERHYSDGLNIHVGSRDDGTLTASMWDDSLDIGSDYVIAPSQRDAYRILRAVAMDDLDHLHYLHRQLVAMVALAAKD